MNSSEKTDSDAEPEIRVPEHVRGLLIDVAYGWSPTPMVLGEVAKIRYANADLSELRASLKLGDDRLAAAFDGPQVNFQDHGLSPFPLDGELAGVLASGATFTASALLKVARGAGMTTEFGAWAIVESQPPAYWIGRIEGAIEIPFGGNMVVERIRSDGLRFGHKRHFRFSGTYVYYLVQSGERSYPAWHLLIDAGAAMPETEALTRDFILLQFVLGRQLSMPELIGVTVEGRTVASTNGTGDRKHLHNRSVPPVPIGQNNDNWIDESWASALFDRVSAAWSARPALHSSYMMAIDSYLDAMTPYVDANYLRLQIALEAFSYWILRLANEEERMVVKDKAAWKRWVKENTNAIRELAAPGFEDSLIGKVMGVYRLSSGRVVPSAFLTCKLVLTEEMATELEQRDVVVHQGVMAPDGYDVEREVRRIALVRTMLVALMAKTAGYAGAINGWELGQLGRPLEPLNWWTVEDDDRRLASRTFVADDSASSRETPDRVE